MKKIILILVLLISGSTYGQQASFSQFFTINSSSSPVFNELNQYADDYKIISVNISDKNSILNTKPENINVNFPVSSTESINITLQKFNVFTHDAKVVEKSSEGETEADVKNSFVAYTGNIPGFENSLVTLTIGNDEVRGILITKSATFVLGKIKDNRTSENDYVFYQANKMKVNNPFICYAGEDNISADVGKKLQEMRDSEMGNNILTAKIALEIDNFTYSMYNSSTVNVTNYVMSIMSTVSAIYLREARVKLEVPYIRIWTTADPYTATTSNAYLNQFRTQWNSTQQGVQRTVAHMISRKFGGLGGIAWLNVLCASTSTGMGYGYSNTTGTVSNFPVYSWDIMVVAHELGHNFGSPHTHSCSWPGGAIDSCYEVEGSCYSGPPIARVGTIMSYCHLTAAGIDLDKGFGPLPKELIRLRAESAPCMTTASEQIILSYPVANLQLGVNSSCRIMWVTAAAGGTVNLFFSSDNGNNWNPIASNVNADLGFYNWTAPYIATSNQCKIRIVNSSNPSIADTSDAFTVKFQFSSFGIVTPTQFTQIQTSPNNSTLVHFIWTKPGTLSGFTYKLRLRKAGNNPDYEYTSNNNGNDTIASLRISQLDSLAAAIGTVGDSVWISSRAWVFTSLDSSQTNNTIIVSLKRTSVGIQQISELIPDKFALYHNYPNPFNPTTNIKFDVPELSNVKISIYDINGREIATLVNNQMNPGSYTADWNATNISSGIYFYRMTTDKFVETRKMMLIK
ncbi:MAG TPA: zinc-dependent metalloprotease [Ignavibacteria bacterium]|nr:zinc-dependent metalloprotease [Ignavibacteria bacterium]